MFVVDSVTGELIETSEMPVEAKEKMEVLVTDELLEKLAMLKALEEQIAIWKNSNKEEIKQIFKEYGIKSFKNDYISITYVEPTMRKSVDTSKLKKEGIYENYLKVSEVKEQIRVQLVEDKWKQ